MTDPSTDGSAPDESAPDENRSKGPTIDLERLEEHARDLYLHRFVEHIKKARGEHGRYLQLRPGDELAIHAAGDDSGRLLDDVVVDPSPGPDGADQGNPESL